jgi:glycosyltransferase involved in cell wall biosynthesis
MWTPSGVDGFDGAGTRRVLMVLESVFPSPGSGGAEGQVLSLARDFGRRGIEAVVVAPRVPEGPQTLSDEVAGIKVVRLPYPRVSKLGGVVLALRLAWLLLARRRSYAAIHAHIANTMAAVACLAGRRASRPVVVKFTGALELDRGILDPQQQSLSSRLLRWALRRATTYQAISRHIAEALPACGFYADRVRLIPNAIDAKHYSFDEADHHLRMRLGVDAKRVGLFLGRLTPVKGLDLLVEAWARTFGPVDNVALLIVGDGPLSPVLRERCGALGIAHEVRFLGLQPDVRPFLAAADFAVLPSEFEGLSNSLLEYLAAGLPVIGSRISGTEDFVKPGENGWLFESRDAEGLARCLREVAAAPADLLREMGRSGQRTVEARAAMEVVTERLAHAYGLPAAAAAPAGLG